MSAHYKLTITGVSPSAHRDTVRAWLAQYIKSDAQKLDQITGNIMGGRQMDFGKNITQEKAEALKKELANIGVTSTVQPMQLTLVEHKKIDEGVDEWYTCPACEHRQPYGFEGKNVCNMCGVDGRQYQALKEKEVAAALERERSHELKTEKLSKRYDQIREKSNERRRRERIREMAGENKGGLIVLLLILLGILAFMLLK